MQGRRGRIDEFFNFTLAITPGEDSDESLCMLADQNLLRNKVDLMLLNFGSDSISDIRGEIAAAVCTHPALIGSLEQKNRRAKARTAWIWTGSGGCRSCISDNLDMVAAPTQAPTNPLEIFSPRRQLPTTTSPFEKANEISIHSPMSQFMPTTSDQVNVIDDVPINPTSPKPIDSTSNRISMTYQPITTSVSPLIAINGRSPSISLTPVTTPIQTLKPTTRKPTTIRPTTRNPTLSPTTTSPTTRNPNLKPTTVSPTTKNPTLKPTTTSPTTKYPTLKPATTSPTTKYPTLKPTTTNPTTRNPTLKPTNMKPTSNPTTKNPTLKPTTMGPTTRSPTSYPTSVPTTRNPTIKPSTAIPTMRNPTALPTTRNPTLISTTRKPILSTTKRKVKENPETPSISAYFPRGLQSEELISLIRRNLYELTLDQIVPKYLQCLGSSPEIIIEVSKTGISDLSANCPDPIVPTLSVSNLEKGIFHDYALDSCQRCSSLNFSSEGATEDIFHGSYVKSQWRDSLGVTIRASSNGGGQARIYNTSLPVFNDEGNVDLGSPNSNCGGFGVGFGGEPGQPGENCVPVQNEKTEFVKANSKGGNITFDFTFPIFVSDIGLIDVDEADQQLIFVYEDGKRETFTYRGLGDNGVQRVITNKHSVKSLIAVLTGTAGVTVLNFCMRCI